MAEKLRRNLWILVVPLLLLATGLAAQRLADYPYDVDELYSIRFAGGSGDGPFSPAEIRLAVFEESPTWAIGMPMIQSVWGRTFGWSAFSMRTLPLFTGLLAISWTFRVGREFYAPLVGLVATAILVSSVLFITYLHVLRSFSAVAMFTVMVVWGYWRLVLSTANRKKSFAGRAILLLGSVGIIYSNYYAITLFVALGIWHLLFIPKNRQWWGPVLLLGLAGLTFLLELEGFLRGIQVTQNWPSFVDTNRLLRSSEVLPRILQVFTNDILNLPSVRFGLVSNVISLALFSLMVVIGFWRFRRGARCRQSQFLLFITVSSLLSMFWINEILLVIREERMRYFVPMWPLIAILLGWVVWRTRGKWRKVAGSLTCLFFLYGIIANAASELRYDFYFLLSRYPLLPYLREMEIRAGQQDLLLIDDFLYSSYGFKHSIPRLYDNHFFVQDVMRDKGENLHDFHEELRVWLLMGKLEGSETYHSTTFLPQDFLFCERYINQKEYHLELHTRSLVHCPSDAPAQMRFGEEIELAESEVELVSADTLRVDLLLHSDEITAMTAYSVAIHVIDVESGEKVAQGDQGLWLGRYNPVRSEIDISALKPGEYEVKIGLYNWQTLERLEGVDLASGVTADLLPLSRFRVE